jgi:hypothetical protein
MGTMISATARQLCCREICRGDIDRIVDLLTNGFRSHHRTRDFWIRAFERLAVHPTPAGFPKYGYFLESKGTPVGVILLIFSSIVANGETRVRCNVSSWYVDPSFRSYAAMLVSRALNHRNVTYFNITPAPHTWPILEAQGYVRYCEGQFVAVPALSGSWFGTQVKRVTGTADPGQDLPPWESDLLLAHAKHGCVSVLCDFRSRRHPFVFAPRRRFAVVPFAYLVYCRDLEDFVRFAGPLGRFLAWRGLPLVIVDSNGPIRGIVGAYIDGRPKYFKGLDPPRLGDLAYSERVIFGV